MKIPEKVRISVDLVSTLKQVADSKPRKLKDLAEALGTTEAFLQQITRKLSAAGYIMTFKGPGGGIGASVNSVKVGDIFRLFGYFTEVPNLQIPSGKLESDIVKLLDSQEL